MTHTASCQGDKVMIYEYKIHASLGLHLGLDCFPCSFCRTESTFLASAFYTRIIVTIGPGTKGFCEAGTPGLGGGGGCAGR